MLEISNADIGGIGPTDQLEVVQTSTDGPTMINETDWLILPVGYNLDDHLNVC
jgi:cellobiose dehydrogenase (acceptor)